MNDTTQRAKRALAALKAADQTGMGRVAGGMGAMATDRLAELDACTAAYRSWTPYLVPGVLQTGTYAACAIRARTPSLPGESVSVRVVHRRRRVEAFLQRRLEIGLPGVAWFVVGETAIVRPLMNEGGHLEQLEYLLTLMNEYPIVIQVLPEVGLMPGANEPFDIHYLDSGPSLGHIETMIGSLYTTSAEDVTRLHNTFNEMVGHALSTSESRRFISEVANSWSAHSAPTTEPGSSSPATATPATASSSLDLNTET